MAQYDDLFGSILISSWLASMLYGVVIIKSWEYVTRYPKDLYLRKVLLLCCIISSLLAMIAQMANVYYPTVTFWGNTAAIQAQYWPIPVYVIANSLTGTMVNSFLIHRLYRLSKNKWIALFLMCCVLLGLAGSIMVGIIEISISVSGRAKGAVAALIWTVSTASADIFIALALIWKLVTMRTSFQSTNSLIQRLVIGAIQTGSTTSTCAVATMVSYYIGKNASNVPTAFHYLVGPFYMLTLLYNLSLQHDGVSGTRSGSRSTDTRLAGTNICMDGIQVHRTAIVSMDPPDGNAPRETTTTQSYGDTKVIEEGDGAPFGAKRVRVTDF
ncbi:hypothetical protein MSAN_00780800 [Mycena sanguinolenta]|uniref:DUF6534 domain-containing protein n=1 Tax=Mycena sanguinolenta TaxID=230812 RepID=A0A8H6Z363_9AGAR|nr:hypothetical protein MSAN_00780800 [Mycena sanguinolenta]